jgi:L-2,4-diaminobutyrate decarboxylase
MYGTELFGEYVDSRLELASHFAALLRQADDFELAVEPEANIVVFRYRPDPQMDAAALDALQARVRRACVEEGRTYFLQTRLAGALWLRTALMNPLVEAQDLDELLALVRAAA